MNQNFAPLFCVGTVRACRFLISCLFCTKEEGALLPLTPLSIHRHQVATKVSEQVVPRTATASTSTIATIALSVEDRISPVPAPKKTIGAIMLGVHLTSLTEPVPNVRGSRQEGGVIVSRIPALRSPSSSDWIVDLCHQVVQIASLITRYFMIHYFLPCKYSTPSPPDLTRCARTDSDGWIHWATLSPESS